MRDTEEGKQEIKIGVRLELPSRLTAEHAKCWRFAQFLISISSNGSFRPWNTVDSMSPVRLAPMRR